LRFRNDDVVCVSGGFDPIHTGHLRMFKEAKELGIEMIFNIGGGNINYSSTLVRKASSVVK
jgi:glycerol-3-phosphate cytidylyltransferase-like family protein